MRTYTVEFTYSVTLDAESEGKATMIGYHWLDSLLRNPDQVLPDNIFTVDAVPQARTVFAGAEKVGA